jgi:hypothetical protein
MTPVPVSARRHRPPRSGLRGKPCPNVTRAARCFGSSEVTHVTVEPDCSVIRWRRCSVCGHRWQTIETDK